MLLLFYVLPFVMLFPACLVYVLPLELPSGFWRRYLSGTVIGIVAGVGFFLWFSTLSNPTPVDTIYWLLRPLLVLVIEALIIRFCTRLPWDETGYCAILAFLTREFCYELCKIIIGFLGTDGTFEDALFIPVNILCPGLVYLGVYFLLARDLPVSGQLHFVKGHLRTALFLTGLVMIPAWLSLVIEGPSRAYNVLTFIHLINIFIALAVLYAQYSTEKRAALEQELALQKRLWAQHEKHMENSRRSMELLNAKYHDIKHYIAALRAENDSASKERVLNEVEESVRVFDSAVRTGNEILDAVLTEKNLLCERSGIVMTCVADGGLLRGIDAVDLYVLLGNALDNAIECVSKLEDVQRRLISIAIFRVQGMVKIQIENPYDGSLSFQGDLPATSKADKESHGFGLKSICTVAERYGGGITVTAEDGQFTLHILLPVEMSAGQ